MEIDKRMQAVDDMQDVILEALGAQEAFDALCRALSYDDKRELFNFLYRMYDLDNAEED